MRIIPKTAKVKVEFFKNISIPDILIALTSFTLEIILVLTNFGMVKYCLMVILLICTIGLFMPVDGQKFYVFIVYWAKYVFSVKNYSRDYKNSASNIDNFIPFKGVKDGYIEYKDYFAGVLQIDPREFGLLSEYKQNQIIDDNFGMVIRSISGSSKASLVKIDRKLTFSKYKLQEEEKVVQLNKLHEAGSISDEELHARLQVIQDRIQIYENMDTESRLERPFYYLVVYDADKAVISEIFLNAKNAFADAGMTCKVLDNKELALFLKYNYTNDFEESDIDYFSEEEIMSWITPQDIRFSMKSTFLDGRESFNYTVRNFPLSVLNAWGYKMFNMPDTKVVMNLEPYEKNKAVKMLDRSVQELASQSEQTYKVSSMIDKQTHINTLVDVMRMLQNDNESLYKVTLHITAYNRKGSSRDKKIGLRKAIKRVLAEDGFELSENYCKQNLAVISSTLSKLDLMTENIRSIHSGSVAAVFPFVLSNVQDDQGVILGITNEYPVIVDFFKRDRDRVNSNMVIMGKSGSGKSYATKTILTHLAAENCKIFILDPENEYSPLCKNLAGRFIDVGTASQGRINPFHVITTLEGDDEGADSLVDNFSVHLQFLEEFFRVALPGIDAHALEYLNNIIVEMYSNFNIDSDTDFSKLEAKDYPIFDDLFDLIGQKLSVAVVDYDVQNLRVLHNFISKFAKGGRNAKLWNGESSLTVKENFTVFNFQSLLANKNEVIANAQMLLVLKWLDNEIIKNRDFNIKYGTNRKIIVAIDEAHVFIDPKYPVALDFMYQLAKRIRKYNGMQIVITQNIKDFVGSSDIIRKSTAIINACQYSFIFALAPNDMDDLCTLYDKAGRINEIEQDQIVSNERGRAFIITSPTARTNVRIVASDRVQKTFGEKN